MTASLCERAIPAIRFVEQFADHMRRANWRPRHRDFDAAVTLLRETYKVDESTATNAMVSLSMFLTMYEITLTGSSGKMAAAGFIVAWTEIHSVEVHPHAAFNMALS